MGKGENKNVRKKKVKVDRVGRQTYGEVVAALAMTTKRRVERMSKDKDLVLVAHLRNVESVLHFIQHHLKQTTLDDEILFPLELSLHKMKDVLIQIDFKGPKRKESDKKDTVSSATLYALKSARTLLLLSKYTTELVLCLKQILTFVNKNGFVEPPIKYKVKRKTKTTVEDEILPTDAANKVMEYIHTKMEKIPRKPNKQFLLYSFADAVDLDSRNITSLFSDTAIELKENQKLAGIVGALRQAIEQGSRSLFADVMQNKLSDYIQVVDEEIFKVGFVKEPSPDENLDYKDPPKDALVGEGTFGQVIKGKRFGQTLAFQHVPLQSIIKGTVSARARSEIILEMQHLWLQFSSDSIVKLYESFVMDDVYYITMELMEMSLHDLIHGQKGTPPYQMSELEVTGALSAIMKGLNFLHSKDIIHRNLNPRNILLSGLANSPTGNLNNVTVKLSDFGFPLLKNELKGDASLSQSEALRYCSPEVLSQNQWTFSADIYSLGLLWWEMNQSNKTPFEGVQDLFKHVVTQKNRPVFTVDKPWMKHLISNCWADEPWNRPTTQMLKNFIVTELKKKLQAKRSIMKQFTLGRPTKNSIEPTDYNAVTSPQVKDDSASRSIMAVLNTRGDVSSSHLSNTRRSVSSSGSGRRNSSIVLQNQNFVFLDTKAESQEIDAAIKVVRTMKANKYKPDLLDRACLTLKSMALNEQFGRSLQSLGAGTAVLNAMRGNKTHVGIQSAGCGTICNLCFSDENSIALMRSGAASLVLLALKTHLMDADVQEEGLKAITNLDHGDLERKRTIISLEGPQQVLVSLRTHLNNQAVVEEACAAIASLQQGFLDDDARYEQNLGKDFYELGALPLILEAMDRHKLNVDLLVEAVAALREMSRVSAKRKEVMVQEGVAEKLQQAMEKYSTVAAMQEIGCGFVSTLAVSHNNVSDELLRQGLEKNVVAALKNFQGPLDESIQIRAMFAIYNLAYQNKAGCKQLKSADALKVLKSSVQAFQTKRQIVEKGVATVALISKNGKP
eukprot:CAMPEP_0184049088 /NCGR_PEP_ID=MMETSP0956-20121227/3205_1 /TAXON_ID=627963 /ORGANISM="Aplanochytrium sp, Strain PBS07" /LENGTH=1014 /DNA_ID=CAMNT_0026341319 /DNA_START=174 /DNA_END=3218 /DNA_ORIENTATION=+